jgi:hypothetical protein
MIEESEGDPLKALEMHIPPQAQTQKAGIDTSAILEDKEPEVNPLVANDT